MLKKLFLVAMIVVMSLSVVGCGDIETTIEVEKSSKDAAEKTSSFEEVVFVDDEHCMFKISGIDEDNLWGYTLKADLENKTDKSLMFSMEDVSVNGYMCDPFWASSVQGGKKAKEDISFSSSSFEELGIKNVETIEFTLSISYEDDWMADPLVEEVFTLTVK